MANLRKQIILRGVNELDETVKLASKLHKYSDEKNYFSVTKTTKGGVKVVTPNGVYFLAPTKDKDLFAGTCKGVRVHCHLKAVSGWIGYF